MEFPYLHYQIYRTCPGQYSWRFITKPPVWVPFDRKNAFIGLLLAKIVETFYRERWWEERDKVLHKMRSSVVTFSHMLTDTERISWRDDELIRWMAVANDTIPLIITTIREEKLIGDPNRHPGDFNEVEWELELQEEGDEIQARLDLAVMRDSILTVLDGKGGKTYGKYVDVDQLHFYSWVAQARLKRLPTRMGFWWFRHQRIKWVRPDHGEVERVRNNTLTAIQMIKDKVFPFTPGTHCRFCDYRLVCEDGQRYIATHRKTDPVEIPGNFGEVGFDG